jgi:hypothetical protein
MIFGILGIATVRKRQRRVERATIDGEAIRKWVSRVEQHCCIRSPVNGKCYVSKGAASPALTRLPRASDALVMWRCGL